MRRRALAVVALTAIPALVLPALPGRSAAAVGGEGSWAAAPPPASAAFGSIQLPDGKALVAQDCQPRVCWQLFDPLRELWSAPALLGNPPSKTDTEKLQTLIGLPNGQALATLKASEGRKFRYNGSGWVSLPPENTWTYIRTEGASTTLLNPPACQQPVRPVGFEDYPCGAVLIAGGFNSHQRNPYHDNWPEVPYTADLYTYNQANPNDPGRILPLNRMPEGQPGHTQGFTILLDDGRVLLAGGFESGDTAVFFDPRGGELDEVDGHRLGAWSSATVMPHVILNRFRPDIWTVRLPGPRPRYLIGGGADLYATPVVFDPSEGPVDPATGKPKGSWTIIDHCTETPFRDCVGGVLRPDGTVLALSRPGCCFIGQFDPQEAALLDPSHDDPRQWRWRPVEPPDATFQARLNTAVLLDGAGKPEQCGANCGLVLAAGANSQGVGTAQLFGNLLEVAGLSPSEGPVCGGRPVTISGRGLERATAVNFGNERVEEITRNPDGSITVPSPRHAPGAVPVTVSTAGGAAITKASANAVFTYLPATAQVSSLSKKEGPPRGGTRVEIAGSFPPECVRSVSFGTGEGRDATAMEVSAPAQPGGPSTKVTATSPPGTPGEVVDVSVNVDPGPPAPVGRLAPSVPTSADANRFTYRALPAITAISKPGVSALGGTEVTLTGTGFDRYPEDADPPRVFFDGQPATRATAVSPTSITAVVPPLAAEKAPRTGVPVTVETDGRGTSVPFTSFAYHPGISGIFPPTGPLTGGTAVTVAGRGFVPGSILRVGDRDATVTRRSQGAGAASDEIVLRTPPHEVLEAVPVKVVVAGLASLEPVDFTYGEAATDIDDALEPDTGPPTRQGDPSVQPAPPGGTGSPAPGATPSLSSAPSPVAGGSPAPGASAAPGGSGAAGASVAPGGAAAPSGTPSQAPSSVNAPVGAAVPAPGPVPVAAPGAAAGQGAPGSGQGALGSADSEESRGARRYAMTDASATLALGGAGAAGCLSWLAAARRDTARRRRASPAGKARPKGAY